MTNEHSGISRRKLLRTTAIAVPTASVLAFGSALVTAPAANALKQDGWWGPETSAGLQRFMNRLFPEANLTVDGVITSQPDYYASNCPGITGGWEWVPEKQATGSLALSWMLRWLVYNFPDTYRNINFFREDPTLGKFITFRHVTLLHRHYGLDETHRLDGPSPPHATFEEQMNWRLEG